MANYLSKSPILTSNMKNQKSKIKNKYPVLTGNIKKPSSHWQHNNNNNNKNAQFSLATSKKPSSH